MTKIAFDHEKLDIYRFSIDYVAQSFDAACRLSRSQRHARDQRLRAAQSNPLNIAEGNGRRSRQGHRTTQLDDLGCQGVTEIEYEHRLALGAGLFAGLNVLPKATYATDYS